jgi:catechol 2,3-dioxygenase-like lactoylglutathione lyase family enzyme
MIDHVSLRVRDLAAAKSFYAATLAPLGYKVAQVYPEAIGLGAGTQLDFWLVHDPEARPQHLAFAARDHASVDAFHAAGLAAGGRDNGAPGHRSEYHPNYYASFVFDLSGNNVEAVCHLPPAAAARPVARKVAKGPKGAPKRLVKGPKGLARRGKPKKLAKGPKGLIRRIAKGPKG